MKREVVIATCWGAASTLLLAALIVAGSRNMAHFDAALVGYTFATLFATFGIAYRYSMWLQRPPTALYWKRGWQVFFYPRFLLGNIGVWLERVARHFVANLFIWKRGPGRGLAHMLLMWGCVIAALITFPLVFGWVHFRTPDGDFSKYQVYLFGFPTFSFPIESLLGVMIFHGLVWASFLVIAGVMLAMRRRMRDRGVAAVQQFGEDFLPLFLLFAISITGLMLTVSYEWMHGYAFEFLSILHAVTVIFTLLYLPFGKFFHIFQRPAQLGVAFYKDVGARSAQAHCRRCNEAFASQMHVDDLIAVQKQLGYRYEMAGPVEHYQRICPRCRRAMLALAQGQIMPRPMYGDSAIAQPGPQQH